MASSHPRGPVPIARRQEGDGVMNLSVGAWGGWDLCVYVYVWGRYGRMSLFPVEHSGK